MGEHLHRSMLIGWPDAEPTSGESLGIRWPATPWKCPACGKIFETHDAAGTVASLARRQLPALATFRCVCCELKAQGIADEEVRAATPDSAQRHGGHVAQPATALRQKSPSVTGPFFANRRNRS